MTYQYDRYPEIPISSNSADCAVGWESILHILSRPFAARAAIVCIECYPGVFESELEEAMRSFLPKSQLIFSRNALKSIADIERVTARDLPDDPVFGRLSSLELTDFFDAEKLKQLRNSIDAAALTIIIGTGASLIPEQWNLLVYADLARWEIQGRQRRGSIGNLGLKNHISKASEKYRRAFFVDWRAADRTKKKLLPIFEFFLDTNTPEAPKLISGDLYRGALNKTVSRPFRLRPFFDPGPWGGQWMKQVCNLPKDQPNYAWCFDCVPEENSLLFRIGDHILETPAINLVFSHPRELLGEAVHARFGTEFPIRFDFLDTMGGGNLSLQVHPLTEYIQEQFGMHYTQDESYYLLDAADDACVYLGLKDDVDPAALARDLKKAEKGESCFDAEKYVNRWPAKKHDHFLIPAGTIHCSGRNSMVLEISATPYIFTFKLWDWGRPGLDGKPRPIHLAHGLSNIQWDRRTGVAQNELTDQVLPVSEGPDWREERTGLHRREFIETRRHWFTGPVLHDTAGGVNVLNLVEGNEISVESPTGAFEPLTIHYAETFVVPAAVGEYLIRPTRSPSEPLATIKAFVRT